MAAATVLNRFEQPNFDNDNALILDGTVETGTGANLKTKLVTFSIEDVSVARTDFVAPGIAGTIVKITATVNTAVDVDTTLVFSIDGVGMTGADIVILATSGEGDAVNSIPTIDNVISTDLLSVGGTTLAEGSVATVANITLEILPS